MRDFLESRPAQRLVTKEEEIPLKRLRARIRVALSLFAGLTLLGSLAAVAPAAAAGSSPFKILVLGDSYSAGNGAGAYYGPAGCLEITPGLCRRPGKYGA